MGLADQRLCTRTWALSATCRADHVVHVHRARFPLMHLFTQAHFYCVLFFVCGPIFIVFYFSFVGWEWTASRGGEAHPRSNTQLRIDNSMSGPIFFVFYYSFVGSFVGPFLFCILFFVCGLFCGLGVDCFPGKEGPLKIQYPAENRELSELCSSRALLFPVISVWVFALERVDHSSLFFLLRDHKHLGAGPIRVVP